MIKRHKFALFVLIGGLWGSVDALANKNSFDVSLGFYSLTGKNSKNNTSSGVSALGAYQLAYRRSLSSQFEIGLGYSVYFSKILTGDTVFGLDLMAQYYPFSGSKTIRSEGENTTLVITELWRPYVGVSFMQRNFQGIQATYVGFAGTLGTQYALSSTLSVFVYGRYAALNASSSSSATEINFSSGVSFGF